MGIGKEEEKKKREHVRRRAVDRAVAAASRLCERQKRRNIQIRRNERIRREWGDFELIRLCRSGTIGL
jgi:hypothetical protein